MTNNTQPVADLLGEMESLYIWLADFRNEWPGRNTPEGQSRLTRMRDAIANATGRTARDVQDDYGTRAHHAAAPAQPPIGDVQLSDARKQFIAGYGSVGNPKFHAAEGWDAAVRALSAPRERQEQEVIIEAQSRSMSDKDRKNFAKYERMFAPRERQQPEALYTMDQVREYADAFHRSRQEPAKVRDACKPGGCSAIGCEGGHYCFRPDGSRIAHDNDALAKAFGWLSSPAPESQGGGK